MSTENTREVTLYRCADLNDDYKPDYPCLTCGVSNCIYDSGLTPYQDNVYTKKVFYNKNGDIVLEKIFPPKKRSNN